MMRRRLGAGILVTTLVAGGVFAACSGSSDVTETTTDTGVDTDTGTGDTKVSVDTGSTDTGSTDTGVADTGSTDTGVADTTAADTGVADTTAADTTVADTGSVDGGATDAGADTTSGDTASGDTAEAGDTGCVPPLGTITGTIYYSRLPPTGEGEIWVAKGDGTSDVKLTNGVWPRLSPDGKYMVFHRDSADPARGNLYVRDLTSGVETKIFTNSDFVVGPSFSADGTKVFFDSGCEVRVVGRDGSGGASILSRDCYDDSPDVRASDSKVAFHNVHSGMWTMTTAGGSVAAIPSTVAGDVWPRWSPSGTKLSFLHVNAETDPQGNVGVIADDGTGRKLLTTLTVPADGFRGGSAVWTPDGNTLVAAGSVCGVNGLYAVSATTGATVRLATATSTTMTKIDFVGTVR